MYGIPIRAVTFQSMLADVVHRALLAHLFDSSPDPEHASICPEQALRPARMRALIST